MQVTNHTKFIEPQSEALHYINSQKKCFESPTISRKPINKRAKYDLKKKANKIGRKLARKQNSQA